MQYEIEKTEIFDKWLKKLRDRKAVLAIANRLDRARLGNFGDTEQVGEGVSEMRIFFGPGYRLYYVIRGGMIIVMLCGGDKSSQKKDIKKAVPYGTACIKNNYYIYLKFKKLLYLYYENIPFLRRYSHNDQS